MLKKVPASQNHKSGLKGLLDKLKKGETISAR